jgi:hypothetical protein
LGLVFNASIICVYFSFESMFKSSRHAP